MKAIQSYESVIDSIKQHSAEFSILKTIIDDLHKAGAMIYLVGGTIRDAFLNLPIKDLDIEVHKIPLESLESILQKYGFVNTVGKSFGVLKLERLPIDWSLPRIDESGRKPQVTIDPWMNIKTAFERRDLTINAMGINLVTYELVDPFNGQRDLAENILRAPNPKFFVEDPLRFYRVMQFVGRFEMVPDKTLSKICSLMDISKVSRERIEEEFKKWILYSKKPSLSIRWLNEIERIQEVLPELAATKNILQEPDWHPEGDVYEHTLQTIDAAARFDYESHEEKLTIFYACLCHDLGKAFTTKLLKGRLTSYDHAVVGVYCAKKLLKRITHNRLLVENVGKLVRSHLYPFEFVEGNAGKSAYKKLALKLAPGVTLAMLAKVALADKQGRNKERGKPLEIQPRGLDLFLYNAELAGVLNAVEQPILQGKDLMPEVEPGPHMGILVKKAYALQLSEGIKDKDILKKLVLDGD